MKKNLYIILILLFPIFAFGQVDGKWTTATIKSSMECGMCERNIENGLSFSKGVKSVEADHVTNEVTVVFNNRKTTIDQIREDITNLGYAADDLKAVPEKVTELAPCCQPGAHSGDN